MIRKFKLLGLATVAVLAMSAFVASAASATNFTASTYPTSGTAFSEKGNDDIKTEAGSIECRVHFHIDPISGWNPKITVTPTFTECRAFGFLNATVNTNGCDFEWSVWGGFRIRCSFGKAMVVTAGTCEITIGEQGELNKVDLANSGNGVSAQATVTGIAYTVTKDGFGCPFGGTGAKTGATYTQNSPVLISSNNGAKIDIG